MIQGAEPKTLGVREDLHNGGGPLANILEAAQSFTPGQPLRLPMTFELLPLYAVRGTRGYGHTAVYHKAAMCADG